MLLVAVGCSDSHNQRGLEELSGRQTSEWNRKLTNVIVADIFTPPVASRIYAYTNVAAYEALKHEQTGQWSFGGRANDLIDIPTPEEHQVYYYSLSSVIAFTTVAKQLVYNGPKIEELELAYLNEVLEVGISDDIYDRSVDFGKKVGMHILEWATNDGYNLRTANTGFLVDTNPGRWRPTPPDYAEAIEPYWNTLRPFFLDSANQFSPGPPSTFDTLTNSVFYKETLEVYKAVKYIDDEKLKIAKFWDCNPNISHTQGHVMYFDQQISPGGHWVHIACQVVESQELQPVQAAATLAKVAVTVADAFISCWDEKYRSSLVRPETFINRYIDPSWTPILQTPAFPEHTSGHSVASASAATMLTHLFGEDFQFKDSTEVPYGLPVRSFDSFYSASDEAAISRLYGGIHYGPAITKGVEQGKRIGAFIIDELEN